MKAGDKYFMASVDIITCINDLQKAKEHLENNLPASAATLLRCVAMKSVGILENVMSIRLSDPSSRISPGCKNECGYPATHCGSEDCKK